jgi:hypothetical protein
MKKINLTKVASVVLSALALGYMACQPDEFGDGNGLSDPSVTASFTVTKVEGKVNTYVVAAETKDVLAVKWDKGDDTGLNFGKTVDTLVYPDAGKYSVILQTIGKGGIMATSAPQDIVVETSDPVAGNIILGGKFETSDDISKWTVLNISASGTSWAFADGKATVTGGGWNQQGFYQTINVVSGRTYKIELTASSTSGASNTWFEVYCSTTAPVQNSDYNSDGIKRNINTWNGCGTGAFSGKISAVGCVPDDNPTINDGVFTASADGVMYLVIKCGGEDLKSGISVDNIEVRGQ